MPMGQGVPVMLFICVSFIRSKIGHKYLQIFLSTNIFGGDKDLTTFPTQRGLLFRMKVFYIFYDIKK